MRSSVFVALSVVLVSACKPSDPSPPGPPQNQAVDQDWGGGAQSARRPPSAAAEALPAPTLEDAAFALGRAGYHGGSTSRAAGESFFELANVPGPDGLVAEVRVLPRRPAPDTVEATLRGRGALMVARKGGVWLAVIVQRAGRPDPQATSAVLEAIIEAAGAARPAPSAQPSAH